MRRFMPVGPQPQSEPVTLDPGRVIQARQLQALTRNELADRLHVSPLTVQQWECGITAPRPDQLASLAEVLHVRPDFFNAGRPFARLDTGQLHICVMRDEVAGPASTTDHCDQSVTG